MKYRPIVYVHGYAGKPGSLGPEDELDPYCGWNTGRRYNLPEEWDSYSDTTRDFEGFVTRLWKDYGYRDTLNNPDLTAPGLTSPEDKARTIWIFRYYEKISTWQKMLKAKNGDEQYEKRQYYEREVLGNAAIKEAGFDRLQSLTGIPQYAVMLADEVINHILRTTGAEEIFLVAHSMGGLISRFAIQYDIFGFRTKVAKFLTLATPHGGASVANILLVKKLVNPGARDLEHLDPDWVRPKLGGISVDDTKFINKDDCYCVVGCNYKDYEILKEVAGCASDGLVRQDEAAIDGVGNTCVYCTHSSIMNSREPYEIAVGFLFGDTRLTITLAEAQFKGKQKRANYEHSEKRYSFCYSLKVAGSSLNVICARNGNVDHTATAEQIQKRIQSPGYVLYDGFLDSACISVNNRAEDSKTALTVNLEFECMEYDKSTQDGPQGEKEKKKPPITVQYDPNGDPVKTEKYETGLFAFVFRFEFSKRS